MKNKLLLLTLMLICCASIDAQQNYQLTGKVKDGSNGEDMIGATVTVVKLSKGTSTNKYGYYSLSLPRGEVEVSIAFIGYQTITRSIDLEADKELNVELKPASEELEEVVVTSERAGDKTFSTQIGMERMQSSTIKKIPVVMGESDILKSIQLLPGITDGGEGTGGMFIRGGSSDQNLVLLDGASVYNSSHLFGFVSTFNTDAINDIQIYKGGIPAKYGGRLSGVLDVTQKEGNNKRFSVNGGIGTISSRLMLEGPINHGKGSFLVAGRRSYADVFLRLANGSSNVIYFYDLNIKGNYQINNNNRVFLSGYFGRDDFGFKDLNFYTSWGNQGTTFRWNHVFNPRLFSNASYVFSDYKFNFSVPSLGVTTGITTHNVKYDLNYFCDKIKFEAGVDAKYYHFNPGVITDNNESLDQKYAYTLDAYLSATQDFSQKLSVTYGLRLSSFYRVGAQNVALYNENQPLVYDATLGIYIPQTPTGTQAYGKNDLIAKFINPEPRLSAVYKFKNSSVKLGYNRMVQYIHLVSNTTAPTPFDTWIPSGKYFDPMTSDQLSVGYFRNLKNNDFEFSVEGFYKKIDNMVDYIDGADLAGNNDVETQILSGRARAYGLEFLFRKNVGKLTGWISYTLSKTERQIPGLGEGDTGINEGKYYPSTYDRPNDLSITAIYKLSDKWSFSSNFIYQTGRPTTYMKGYYFYNNEFVPNYEDRNQERLPSYNRLDLSATLTPKKNKHRKLQMEYVFGIYNVYNRHNASTISFDMDKDTGAIEAKKTWIFGIVPSATINFKF